MSARATANRKVMRESWKWRPGRARDRVVSMRAFGLGGKSSCAFSDEEGETGERATDVTLPTGVGATLEVVDAQLAFHTLVGTLGSPALFDAAPNALTAVTGAP